MKPRMIIETRPNNQCVYVYESEVELVSKGEKKKVRDWGGGQRIVCAVCVRLLVESERERERVCKGCKRSKGKIIIERWYEVKKGD